MSLRVLVIPEDPTHNGYILKPLVEAVSADLGKPSAKVQVLTSPRLNGYDHAMAAIRNELPTSYGHLDLWLFMPDADRAGAAAMSMLEAELQGRGVPLICCPAQPEVEIYACAAYRTEIAQGWPAARSNPRMKEEVFAPLLAAHGDPRRAGGGRDQMVAESLRNLPLLYSLCPELRRMRDRVELHLSSQKR